MAGLATPLTVGLLGRMGLANNPNLVNNLAVYWKLNEASGDASDSIGSLYLSDNNSVGSTTGKIGNGRSFNGSTQYLSHASNSTLETGDIDFTIAAWVKLNTFKSSSIVAKDTNTGRDYTLDYDTGGFNCFRWYLNGGLGGMPAISATGTFSTGVWYHIVAWHDSVNNLIGMSINNGNPQTASTSGLAPNANSGTEFRIGARQYPGNEDYTDGVIDEVGFWKNRVLSAQDRSDLYNLGSGLGYPFTIIDNVTRGFLTPVSIALLGKMGSGSLIITNITPAPMMLMCG
jgi:hypothetical protein